MTRVPLMLGALAVALLLSAVAIALLSRPPKSLAGFVIDVNSSGIVDVQSFTIRTAEGVETTFIVGPLELDGGAFPAGHLREHMALGQAVAVAYREAAGELVAYRLVDATWLQR